MASSKRRRRFAIGCLVVILLPVFVLECTGPGKAAMTLWRNGMLQALVTPIEQRKYQASRESNLRAMRTALMLYHDSEGQFPQAAGWMDAIKNRIEANDLSAAEAAKKLVRPDLAGNPGQFGYALNSEVAGKYKGDIKDPDAILVFESKSTQRNASGDPKSDTLASGMAITISGNLKKASPK